MTKRTAKPKFDLMEFARINGIRVQSLSATSWVASIGGRAVYSSKPSTAILELLKRYRGSLVYRDTILTARAASELIRGSLPVVAPDSPTPPPRAESADETLASEDAPAPAPRRKGR